MSDSDTRSGSSIESARELKVADFARSGRPEGFRPAERLKSSLIWQPSDLYGQRYRIKLYRFLADHVPIISACIWTWSRLSSAAGAFVVDKGRNESSTSRANDILDRLEGRMFANRLGQRTGLSSLLPDLFTGLFRDGFFGGFVTVFTDGSGVDQFVPIDPCYLVSSEPGERPGLFYETERKRCDLNRSDFYYLSLGQGETDPLGASILKAIPFVSYIEQQLVDDMRRASHNSGYHRLHVKITPPERMAGESDNAYTDRSNRYFDDTVRMIRDAEVEDNPVTWDNIAVEYIGPSATTGASSAWFMNHRAMIEDICAGTNLAPYLLGYSYGATTTWSGFKFDVVMRQVRSIQAEVSRFLEWIGNIELALAGVNATCRFEFDNSFSYQALDQIKMETGRIDNLLKLYEAGLIDKETAADRAGGLI